MKRFFIMVASALLMVGGFSSCDWLLDVEQYEQEISTLEEQISVVANATEDTENATIEDKLAPNPKDSKEIAELKEVLRQTNVIADLPKKKPLDYTNAMIIFSMFGVLALFFSLWLKKENKKRNFGLEEPNIKK